MYFKGKLNFCIIDSNILTNDIEKNIGFTPTKIINRGQQITAKLKSPYNIWIYELSFDDTNFDEKLLFFVNHLLLFKDNLQNFIERHEKVELNFYINTQYGQFGFTIPSNILTKISQLGIDVNFHLLSYGEVE